MKSREKPETPPNTPEVKEEPIADLSGKEYFTVPYEKPIRWGSLTMFQSLPVKKEKAKKEESQCLVK